MDSTIESLTKAFSSLSIDVKKIVLIQKWYRGCAFRLKRLPLIMYKLQSCLEKHQVMISNENADGRLNSCNDEEKVVSLLTEKFGDRIKTPKIRMWYDILAYDDFCGWIPINIKSTTMITSDNTGNLAMCVYAYTNYSLDLHKKSSYENGKMSILLVDRLKRKHYNKHPKKDYYFIVVNKTKPTQIIINSVKGLSILTPNINNLPFQVCWNKNKYFVYQPICKQIQQFMDCLKKPKPSWKETFLSNVRSL